MILLQPVIQILAIAMPHTRAQHRAYRPWITVVPICRHPVRRDTGDDLRRLEKCLRRGHVTVFAEHHVDQRAGSIDGAIELTPLAMDLDVRLVDVPAAARFATSASPQTFSQRRRDLNFLIADRLMAESDATDQEHLRQIAQGKFVSQTPEHHEGDNVAGVLRPVQNASTPLVELLAAGATAEPPVTLGGALTPFRDRCRAAPNAFHLANSSRSGPITLPRATGQEPWRER
jgi:hypothetical protein